MDYLSNIDNAKVEIVLNSAKKNKKNLSKNDKFRELSIKKKGMYIFVHPLLYDG